MKFFLLLPCVIAVSSALPAISEEWNSFKAKHGKSYSSPNEERYRYQIYLSNKEMVEQHNLKYEAGLVSYKLKLNHFSDKLPEEISAQMNGFNRSGELANKKLGLKFTSPDNFLAPSEVDWRQKGAVTSVKNQGQCGACWAFSATGAIEGQLFRKTGKLVSLSEQNLVDCSGDYDNQGCNGGLMDQAFEYVRDNGGIDTEESYPYEGSDYEECRYSASKSATSLRRFVDIPQGDEEALKKAVASVGPISVAINAGLSAFTHYGGGVFDNPRCDPEELNHGVLLVGYGSEDGQDYWLIKNSWSTAWGENGYVKIARNLNNLCGVASVASYPVL